MHIHDPIDPPAVARSELPSGTVIDSYRIDAVLREGGMSTVYGATHTVIGKRAAIKVISAPLSFDATSVGRFVQEARAVNAICHPNIIDVFAFGELPDGRCYSVMELLEGETLSDLLRRRSVDIDEAIAILLQVCAALGAAHEKAIVHRDVKPENLFVLELRDGKRPVKLLDFGLAKLVDSDERPRRTRTGCIMGTPSYMSPEQVRGKDIDVRADVYSLGVVAYEMLAGHLPLDAETPYEITQLQVHVEPEPLGDVAPGIPGQLAQLVMAMLRKDAAARPPIAEVTAALRDLRERRLATTSAATAERTAETAEATAAPPEATAEARPPDLRPPRGRWLAPSLATAVAVAALFAWRSHEGAARVRPSPAKAKKVHAKPAARFVPTTYAADRPALPPPDAPPPSLATAPTPPPPSTTRPAHATPSTPPRLRKVGRKQGRDYVVDPFAWKR